jgi:hypothetical protein
LSFSDVKRLLTQHQEAVEAKINTALDESMRIHDKVYRLVVDLATTNGRLLGEMEALQGHIQISQTQV